MHHPKTAFMALLKDNALFQYVEGSIGDQISIYKRNGQTIVAKKRGRSRKKPTKNQVLARQKMAEAVGYARAILKDPEMKAYYQSKAGPGQNAWNMAISDALKSPEVQNIQAKDNAVVVTIRDKFAIAAVDVKITDAAGILLEKGKAVLSRNGVDWHYRAANLPGGATITVIAVDLPGNEKKKEIQLE